MYDTIIIGAGLSGLAAGIRLAYYGQRVCILERHYAVGGLNSFYRLDGRNYDVGLHAVTNFTPKGTRRGPLARLLRQLKFSWDDLELVPQVGSSIAFPGVSLKFNNDFELLRSQIHQAFPDQKDNLENLLRKLLDYDQITDELSSISAREVLSQTLSDPLLIEMLLLPVMFYGNAREHDMDFGQFCIMFRSVYLEGFARPVSGIRLIIKKLIRKFRELGGELRLRAGVARLNTTDGRVGSITLDSGEELSATQILSSAGAAETERMCSPSTPPSSTAAGQLSFVETLAVIKEQPADVGLTETIVFYNDSERVSWQKPPGLVDVRSGVICSPNNFQYDHPLDEGMVRITALANFDSWQSLPEDEYREQKRFWYDKMLESAVRFVPDFRKLVVANDMFTPKTIHRFTWHDNGAVYGAPKKRLDGVTHLKNLFLCGTDQGFVGIIGAITSGIAMANQHILSRVTSATGTETKLAGN